MSLKNVEQAGACGTAIANLCRTANTVFNSYGGPNSPLEQTLAAYALTCSIPDNAANQAAVQSLVSSVVLPTGDQYTAAGAGLFDAASVSDCNAIFTALRVALYVLGKMQATLPVNDV